MTALSCTYCGLPTRITKEQALELECDGLHFIEAGANLVPVRKKGLQIGKASSLEGVEYGVDLRVGMYSTLFQCKIGAHTKIKHYVEIQGGVEIGKFCKIESYCFIPTGVKIGNYVFLGPGVKFTNDKYPEAVGEWEMRYTEVGDNTSIGAGCIILPGLKIGKGCLIGAGSVVTKDVKDESIYYGNPAKFVRPL